MIWWHCYSTFIDAHLWVILRFGYVAQSNTCDCYTFWNAQLVITYQFSCELFPEVSLYFYNNLYKVACQTNQCTSINITINIGFTTWQVWNIKYPELSFPLFELFPLYCHLVIKVTCQYSHMVIATNFDIGDNVLSVWTLVSYQKSIWHCYIISCM